MAELDDLVCCSHSAPISGRIKGQTIYWVMEVGSYEITGIFHCARLTAPCIGG